MSRAAARIETFVAGARPVAEFERVREALGIYGGPEPAPPGAMCAIASRHGEPIARCAWSVARGMNGAPGATGMIGNYEALEKPAGVAVLREAIAALEAVRVERVLGPMNGSTWGRYRFALPAEPGTEPEKPFASEPWNPPDYPEHFAAAGFRVAARYESRAVESLAEEAANAAELAEKVREAGIRVRSLDPARFEEELQALFAVSLEAFADNLYYTPIGFAEFRAMYDRLRPILDPELVPIAEDASGRPVAFQFAFLDPLSMEDGVPTRAIVKTVATAPAARGRGLAGHLLDLLRKRAHEHGCRMAIHALMHVANFSMSMSARHQSRVFRRYELYEWSR